MAEIYSAPHIVDNQYALRVHQIEKVFGSKGNPTYALNGLSFDVANGEFVAVMGPSGSGKTTLLNCIATIDKPTSGTVMVGQTVVTHLGTRALAKFRREELGFIFQDANLLDTLTGFENIALPLSIRGEKPGVIESKVKAAAESLGVSEVLDKFPGQMSGGQRQRVAAARAIICEPKLILADEPTGALDSRNATVMLETLSDLNKRMGATIMMVTHDAYAASHTSRVIFVKDGRLFTELLRGADDRGAFFARIMEVQSFLGGETANAR